MKDSLTAGLEDSEAIMLWGDYHNVNTLGLVNFGFCQAERTTPRQRFAWITQRFMPIRRLMHLPCMIALFHISS